MDARKHLIIIKGKDQTDSVASFQFHDGKCEVVYTSAPNKSYSFQSSNVEILPLQKKIDPAQVIVTVNGQTISGIDEILDFGGYYRIVRNGKRDFSFRRNEVQFQQNCLTDGTNQEIFQYFKETAAAISLEVEGINILSMQYDKIKQVSEDTVLASYLAPQKEVKVPQMPEAVIYPFGMNRSQKLAVERALSSKISIIQGPPGTGKTQTILNIIANVVRSGKTVAVVSNNNSATHNVAEKLEKKNASFLTAFLGSLANKQKFLENQTGAYPNMSDWEMPTEERQQLDQETTALSQELNEMLNAKNRIAEIEQEFLQLNPEQHYFEEYYATYSDAPTESLDKLSSQKILALWMEFEQHAEHESRLGLLQKLSIMFRFNRNALKLFLRSPELVIPYLQSQFYSVKRRELEAEKQELNRKLEHYAFDAKMDELTQKSLRLFRAELATRYHWQSDRRRFEKNDFRWNSAEFTSEYPVVLSTTYSIKGTLSIDHIYDYLIVDEASQVDLATGVLAFSCARNIVIVGDLKQLPNVLTEDDIRTSDAIWQKYSLDERYRFSTHSLLSSALEIWQDAPVTLLREHYRCHPKIINFCNQKFYHTPEKKRVLKHGGYLYQLDPYALEWKNDHYYLIGFSHKHQRMAHFRVDRLSGIKILPSGFTPDEDFDVAGYTNKIVDMFAADRTVSVELLCENKLMKTIIDHYGEAVPTRTYDEEHFTANIEVDPSGTFYGWVFKFMGGIQIIAPHECVEEMKRIAHRFL